MRWGCVIATFLLILLQTAALVLLDISIILIAHIVRIQLLALPWEAVMAEESVYVIQKE